MTEQPEDTLENGDQEHSILEIEQAETRITKVKRQLGIRVLPGKLDSSPLLQGKTLQVYWYLLEHGPASVREVHNALNISSPGLVYYQIQKLLAAEIVTKDEETEKYIIHEKVKTGILDLYIEIGGVLIPRFSVYLVVFLLGFVIVFFSFLIWGDQFITHPGVLLLFFFLLFGSLVFIYESRKINKLKPN